MKFTKEAGNWRPISSTQTLVWRLPPLPPGFATEQWPDPNVNHPLGGLSTVLSQVHASLPTLHQWDRCSPRPAGGSQVVQGTGGI